MDAINKVITDIRVTMGRMEEKIDNMSATMNEAKTTAEKASATANKAMESTKSAHRRLDKVDKIIFWVSTTIIGFVMLALIATLWQTTH